MKVSQDGSYGLCNAAEEAEAVYEAISPQLSAAGKSPVD